MIKTNQLAAVEGMSVFNGARRCKASAKRLESGDVTGWEKCLVCHRIFYVRRPLRVSGDGVGGRRAVNERQSYYLCSCTTEEQVKTTYTEDDESF